jgi:hypothetical protein
MSITQAAEAFDRGATSSGIVGLKQVDYCDRQRHDVPIRKKGPRFINRVENHIRLVTQT